MTLLICKISFFFLPSIGSLDFKISHVFIIEMQKSLIWNRITSLTKLLRYCTIHSVSAVYLIIRNVQVNHSTHKRYPECIKRSACQGKSLYPYWNIKWYLWLSVHLSIFQNILLFIPEVFSLYMIQTWAETFFFYNLTILCTFIFIFLYILKSNK